MEDNTDDSQSQKGCKECCERCVGSLPWASLLATVLLYMGVALFCGCGHEALSGTSSILQNYFELLQNFPPTGGGVEHLLLRLDVFTVIDLLQYVLYGLAGGSFLLGVLLLVDGFFTTGAIRELYGAFKTSGCGRCLTGLLMLLCYLFCLLWLLMLLSYLFCLLWLVLTACSGLPVFLYFNVNFLMALAANWAYLKDASRAQKYEDAHRSKDDAQGEELHDVHTTRSKERLNAYT
ncbi:hypothetical protein NHX12_015574 [Muraenolepis orangiensis]|uniref:Neuronal membrane glycoprotein M6-a n=1 Tax=Muraenolepis orangiensis TaxID=630683 RepID=A0A9Q0DBZ8_9TELE|nr:hypothetical protein NHX12_015574 [Muraenolepis orangiensis]